MSRERLLLCTDMDRTVIPNGAQPEHPMARKRFIDFCSLPEITLVYVTGRHQELVQEAIHDFQLPEPDYVITDVGSKIYTVHNASWTPLITWEEKIDKDWKGRNHAELKALFCNIPELELQEESKQNTHKLSYYLSLETDQDVIIAKMKSLLKKEQISAGLIWSIDEPRDIGLLDVLPQSATKLSSIEFLSQQLEYEEQEVLFAGDSGNDLQVLESRIPSVLVANASQEVRLEAQRFSERKGNSDTLYCASGQHLDMNGNYTAGILEGVWHFVPGFRDKLLTL